jgi:hypothetical protein
MDPRGLRYCGNRYRLVAPLLVAPLHEELELPTFALSMLRNLK